MVRFWTPAHLEEIRQIQSLQGDLLPTCEECTTAPTLCLMPSLTTTPPDVANRVAIKIVDEAEAALVVDPSQAAHVAKARQLLLLIVRDLVLGAMRR